METVTTTRLVAVYGRVSTSNQENEGTIETQLSAVREFARNNGCIIVQEYLDNGWSGDILARPALDQLRMDAKKKTWEAVLFYDPDRLARRYSFQELIMDELRESGIEPLFVTIPPSKNNEDRLLYGVRGVFAEYERVKIAERFRLGKVRKAKENHIIATEAPYGYTFITRTPEKQTHYIVNDKEAEIVKKIFTWVADEGLTLRSVVRRLQELKILPRKSKRGVWSTSTLSTLLRNRTYIGEGHYGASYATVPLNPLKKDLYRKIKKTSRKIRPEEEWIKISTPKIIDENLFNLAGKRLRINFELAVRNTKNEYLLGGKIYCICGQRRCGEGPQQGKHLYYRCNDRVFSFPLPRSCHERAVNARIADELVWNKISQLMSSPELMNKQAARWMNNKRTQTLFQPGDLERFGKEIVKLKKQEDRYNKAYGEGAFSIEKLKEYTIPLKDRIILLESQITELREEEKEVNSTNLPTQEEIQQFAKTSLETLKNLSFEAKKGIISNVLEKVVGTQKKLQVCG